MSTENSDLKTYFGRCRCCLHYGYLKSMWKTYHCNGDDEVYGKMLTECYVLSWEHPESVEHDQICEPCIEKLRGAYNFRKLVIESQTQLMLEIANDMSVEQLKVEDLKKEERSIGEFETVNIVVENGLESEHDLDVEDNEREAVFYEDVEYLEEETLTDTNKKETARHTSNVESREALSDPEELNAENNAKKSAVWTKRATIAMLSLYEANIQMLKDMGRRSQVWKKISEGLTELGTQVTTDQVKWKFNRLYTKYKHCVNNNNKRGRTRMTFEYYEHFEKIFRKEKNVSTPHTLSSTIFSTDGKKRQHDIDGSRNIDKAKKNKFGATSSRSNPAQVDQSSKLKTSSVASVNENAKSQQHFQSVELLQNILENQKAKDKKMTKYLKMKEKEMELKKKQIDVCETETHVKKDVANEKLKFNEKKHEDWLNIEKMKCELLKKLLENRNDSGQSDSNTKSNS